MPFSVQEQALYDHLRATLPRFLFQRSDAPEEIWGAYVKIFDRVRQEVDTWQSYAQILEATGIWLNQHAKDRGTFRQEDETDEALRERLKSIEDSVTWPALRIILERIADTESIVGDFYLLELAYKMAFMGAGASLSLVRASSQYAAITDAAQKGLDIAASHTIEFWIRPNTNVVAPGNTERFTGLVGKAGAAGQISYNTYLYHAATNQIQLVFYCSGDGTNAFQFNSSGSLRDTLLDGNFHHVAFVFTAGTGAKLYVDGVEKSGTTSGSVPSALFNSTADFRVGAFGADTVTTYDGDIADVRIWDRALAASELGQNSPPSDRLQGHWKLDGNVLDSSPNGNNLTAFGTPTYALYDEDNPQSFLGDGTTLGGSTPGIFFLDDGGDTNVNTVAIPSQTPTAGRIPILAVMFGGAGAGTGVVNIPDFMGCSWQPIQSLNVPGDTHKIILFKGVGTPVAGSGNIYFSATMDNIKWELLEISSNSILQVKTATVTAGTGLSATFGPAFGTLSLGLAYTLRDVNNITMDEEAGWTEMSVASALGFSGSYPMSYLSMYKAPLTDLTPSCTFTTGDAAMIALEIGPQTNGDRMTAWPPNTFVILVPPTTDAATLASMYEALRLQKAAGFRHFLEVQL